MVKYRRKPYILHNSTTADVLHKARINSPMVQDFRPHAEHAVHWRPHAYMSCIVVGQQTGLLKEFGVVGPQTVVAEA